MTTKRIFFISALKAIGCAVITGLLLIILNAWMKATAIHPQPPWLIFLSPPIVFAALTICITIAALLAKQEVAKQNDRYLQADTKDEQGK